MTKYLILISLILTLTFASYKPGKYQICTEIPKDGVVFDSDTVNPSGGHHVNQVPGYRHKYLLSSYYYNTCIRTDYNFSKVTSLGTNTRNFAFTQWFKLLIGNRNSSTMFQDIGQGIIWHLRLNKLKFGNGQEFDLILQKWYHIVVNFVDGQLFYYINGIKQTHSVQLAGNVPYNKFKMYSHISYGANFKYHREGIKFFNRALTYEEILCLGDRCPKSCYSRCKLGKCDATPKNNESGDKSPVFPTDVAINLNNFTKSGVKVAKGMVTDKALFISSDSYAYLKPDFPFYDQFTISFWGFADTAGEFLRFENRNRLQGENTSRQYTNLSGFRIFLHTDKKLYFQIYSGTSASVGIEYRKWNHVVLQRSVNISNDDYIYQFYVNKKLVGSIKDTKVGFGSFYSFSVGRSNTNNLSFTHGNRYMSGMIDDFRIYWRPLNPEEVLLQGGVCSTQCTNGQATCATSSTACVKQFCAKVYDKCNYDGEEIEICGKNPEFKLTEIKSLKIKEGYKLSVFNSKDYQTQKATFTESQKCLEKIEWKEQSQAQLIQVQEDKNSYIQSDEIQHQKNINETNIEETKSIILVTQESSNEQSDNLSIKEVFSFIKEQSERNQNQIDQMMSLMGQLAQKKGN